MQNKNISTVNPEYTIRCQLIRANINFNEVAFNIEKLIIFVHVTLIANKCK